MANEPKIGDVFETKPHEYYRKVRIVAVLPDGRFQCVNVTSGVRTKIKAETLRNGWAFVGSSTEPVR